jgi:hypothetical protein
VSTIRWDRDLRNKIATIGFALSMASFGSFFFLSEVVYRMTRFTQANSELGFVHPWRISGARIYLSAAEAMGLNFLGVAFIVGLVLFLVVVPKAFVREIISTPEGFRNQTVYTHDLVSPTSQQYKLLVKAIIGHLGIIFLVGPRIVDFALAHGIVH